MWERTKTPEFRAFMKANVAEANKNITHADFVAGILNGTMGFQCMFCGPFHFIRGVRRTIFSIFVFLYTIAPAIFVTLWAWHENNWWLLAGIVVSAVGTLLAAQLVRNQDKQNSIAGWFLVAFIGSWFEFGIHNYFTFFAMCGSWGMMFFMIAENAQKEYAIQSFIEHPEVFEDATARGWIRIVRKDDESN